MYVCQTLDEVSNTCMEWVVYNAPQTPEPTWILALSQADAYLVGQWVISFFAMCAAYAIIVKAIKLA